MKQYNLTNRVSKEARVELERIILTHNKYKKSYFFKPNGDSHYRNYSVKKFKKMNPDVSFLKNGSLITVKMEYDETSCNVYYKLNVTVDDNWKCESSSNPIKKNITLINNLLK
jgi:hypothetical protein